MKYLLILPFFLLSFVVSAQTVVVISSADTSYIKKDTVPANAELILRNGTRNVTNGVAYNAGNGWIKFKGLELSDINGLNAILDNKLGTAGGIGTGTFTFDKIVTNSDASIRGVNFGLGGGGLNTNLSLGYEALQTNTTGAYNVAIGFQALQTNTTPSYNTAIGYYTLRSVTTGYGNTAIGAQALFLNTTGRYNLGIGLEALARNTTGENNTGVGGYDNMLNNTTGNNNTSLGYATMYSNTTGSGNVAIGINALYKNTTSNANVAVGPSSGYFNTGEGNVFIGSLSGYHNTAGSNNVYIGNNSGLNATGSRNIVIGNNITTPSLTDDDQINIGDLIYGNLASKFMGIGYSTDPDSGTTLAVNGKGFFNGNVAGNTFVSNALSGTAPLTVASSTLVENLNTERWNGFRLNLTDSTGIDGLVGYRDSTLVSISPAALKTLLNGTPENNALAKSSAAPATPESTQYLPLTGGYLSGGLTINSASGSSEKDKSDLLVNQQGTRNGLFSTIGFSWSESSEDRLPVSGISFKGTDFRDKKGDLILFSNEGKAILNNDGDFTATGNVTAYSDRRLKKNINTILNVSDKLRSLNAVEFDRIDIKAHQLGFIAQDMELIFPELVITGSDARKTKSINYQALTSPLLKGWQESDARIESLEKENQEMKKSLNSLQQQIEELKKLLQK